MGIQKVKLNTKKKEHNLKYFWIAMALYLGVFVPLLNIFLFLPAAFYFSVKGMKTAKRNKDNHLGFYLCMLSAAISAVSCIYSFYVLLLVSAGKIV